MVKIRITLLLLLTTVFSSAQRGYWEDKAYEMAYPLLENLSQETLRKNMPQEHPLMDRADFNPARSNLRFTHLEAVGRLLCGIAPWLECVEDKSPQRAQLLALAHRGLANAVNPRSPDYLIFDEPSQPLVDAAFLAQAFLRSPTQLWEGLDAKTKESMIQQIKSTRKIKPNMSNWLLFSAMIETFLCYIDQEYRIETIEFAFEKMEEWYKGDGIYGDGKDLHNDYYNSFVIQPMMVDIVRVMNRKVGENRWFGTKHLTTVEMRATRYGEILERSISPEGTFPVVGRSILYRTGAMQSLAQAVQYNLVPADIRLGQIRSALTLVIFRLLDAPNTYDKCGWLTMGLVGNAARKSGESYLSTGSMYLAATIFLPLGLPENAQFWRDPAADWTSKRAWEGKDFPIDGSLK